MSDAQVVLVTGVAGYWGGRVAEELLKLPGFRVIGIDTDTPQKALPGLTFIESDVRNPLLPELFKGEGVSTVYHLGFKELDRPSDEGFEQNVIGTIKLFGACVHTGVRKIVLRSSTSVYGACPDNSMYLAESHPFRGHPAYGYNRDMVEIETFCNGFAKQNPEIGLTLLRFAHIVGLFAPSPMTRYLGDPLASRLLGFDPMMQVIHEEDVVRSLLHCAVNDHPGIFNIAAEGVMPLTHLSNLAGKITLPLPHFLAYLEVNLLGAGGLSRLGSLPIEPDFLRYPCVGDTSKMKDEMQFIPTFTAEETLQEFATQRHRSGSVPASSTTSEEHGEGMVEGSDMDRQSMEDTPVDPRKGD